jgi:tRNA (guanine-N7-)-methyltransferase
MTIVTDHPDRNRRKLYGRRKGPKLSARQVDLRRTLLGELAYRVGENPLKQFPNSVHDVWLEVGFGAGEHLIWQAQQHPHVGLIGAEPYEMGVAKALTKLEESQLNTVRIYEGDGREIIEALPDNSLGRFFLLFPDPWPKKKHLKRRLLTPETAVEIARVLKPGGKLRFASDSADYASEALRILLADGSFEWTAESAKDWRERASDWPETRYERKALRAGRKPAYLSFRRL